jgi:corrinoid protein of di/trimethylamine methyltransferase
MTEELFAAMRQSVIDGDADAAAALAEQALADGVDPLVAIDEAYVPGIRYVGEQFRCGDLFLPDMMLAARAMQKAVAVLEPEMLARSSQRKVLGRVVLGTVKGDIHEIGKNLVAMMLTANGFEVHDLGVDVAPERFVEKAKEVEATMVGVSALLTTTMTGQRAVVQALADAGLREQVKVIVGGAPVTKAWATEIGADGYGEDAVGAVTLARELAGA